ncbi:MAG: hypothetical protein JXA79_11225 [Deltaproteobacteria bacterium]|nr:hypothetical protein [Deltaproteobacteria bacterium]
MAHNMNPFDFVPFPAEKPVLKTIAEWLKSGSLLTGWIESQITALTPVHIVGRQEADGSGRKIIRSHFYRRHGQAYIPASSIRGMLRAFIEAVCNGWAAQLTTYFKKEPEKHQIGFQVLDSREELEKKECLNLIDPEFRENHFALPDGFSMPQKLKEEESEDMKVDLASFLFGYIPPKGDGFHGRISIEDAAISPGNLSFNGDTFRIPDIQSDAFMGGGKPSASSWWYQKAYKIRLNRNNMPEFIGSGYRGRKFYYHQDPKKCLEWYFDESKWPRDTRRPLYSCPIECLEEKTSSEPFRIYFEGLPAELLNLLLFTFSPGKRIRHKLGYGKAYGYGSIAFTLHNGQLRTDTGKTDLAIKQMVPDIHISLLNKDKRERPKWCEFLHLSSLAAMAKILCFEPESTIIFSYPPFSTNAQFPGFLPSVRRGKLNAALIAQQKNALDQDNEFLIDDAGAKLIAKKLASKNVRPALHFEVYRETSKDYLTIEKRTLENAL